MLNFEEIYSQYAERILNLVYRMVSDPDIAQDLTQDIFVKVYRNLGMFQGHSSTYTWIHRIAVNHVLDHLKHEKRSGWFDTLIARRVDEVGQQDVDPAFSGSGMFVPPDVALEHEERARAVRQALTSLEPPYRVPLMLHHYEGMSYKEIAELMNLSMSAVESRIHRAKKQLVKKLEHCIR